MAARKLKPPPEQLGLFDEPQLGEGIKPSLLRYSAHALNLEAKREAFAEKKEARIERMRARADKKERQAEALHGETHRLAEVMAGTPILVGHHSEKRHRRDLARMQRKDRKGAELRGEAAELERRAHRAETTTAVSSDDPDAVARLETKVAAVEAEADRMVQLNKLVGRKRRNLKPAELERARARLEDAGVGKPLIAQLLKPDFGGRYGMPAYAITNRRSEVRRLRKRITELKTQAAAAPRAETIGDVRLAEEDNRLRLYFPGKPSADTRKQLKAHGFKWSPRAGAWQRMPSSGAWYYARRIVHAQLGET